MIDACDDELLIGEDFLQDKAALMNFMTMEVTYYDDGRQLVILPFHGIRGQGKEAHS